MRCALMCVLAAGLAAPLSYADVSLQTGTGPGIAVYQPGATGIGTFSWFNSSNLSNTNIPYSVNIGSSAVNGNLLTDGTFSSGSSGYVSPNNISPLRSFLWSFRPVNGSTSGVGLGASSGGIGTMTTTPGTIAQGTSSANIGFSNVQLGATGSETYRFSVSNDVSVTKPGVGQAFITNSITITNTAATVTQSLEFGLMVDSQILGTGGGSNDTFTADTGTSVNGVRLIGFTDSTVTNPATGQGGYTVNFGALNPDHWEAGTETTAGSAIRTRLASSTNGTTNQLTDAITATSGDRFGGYTWRVTLAPGQSATFTGYIGVNTAVPAPGAVGLLGLSGLVALRRRR